MLSSKTPSGTTLNASWFMSWSADLALAAAIGRHLAPFLSSGITVYREAENKSIIPALVIMSLVVALDAATFGSSIAAACRPLSSVVFTPLDDMHSRRTLAAWFQTTSPPPPPTHPPPSPLPPSPIPPPPPVVASWSITGTMMTPVKSTNAYGNAETEAMITIACMSGLAALAWIRVMYAAAKTTDSAAHKSVIIYILIGCAIQVWSGSFFTNLNTFR